jgi:hypothetical protein
MSAKAEADGTKYDPFDHAIKAFENLLSITRHDTLQRAAITDLTEWRAIIAKWKHEAIDNRNQSEANYCLGLECICDFYESELNMWLFLKEKDPDHAWGSLISAQNAIANVIRSHSSFESWSYHAERLEEIERLVFPPQKFVSIGLHVKEQICSICGVRYEDCPHLVGIPYWGRFCWRILKDYTPDHVAFVEKPANKRCRVLYAHVEGGKRNYMTWQVEPLSTDEQESADGPKVTKEGPQFTVNIMHVDDLMV